MGGEAMSGGGKARIRAADFRTLAVFLQGYLHQDFRAEYKTPKGALKAYCRDTTPREVERLKSELSRFVEEIRAWPFRRVHWD